MSIIKDVVKGLKTKKATISQEIKPKNSVTFEDEIPLMPEKDKRFNTLSVEEKTFTPPISKTIALIVPDSNYPFFTQFLKSVQSYINKDGYSVMLLDTNIDEELEKSYIQMLLDNNVKGMIVASRFPHLYDHLTLPLVGIDDSIGPKGCLVSSDNYEGGNLVAEAFIKHKCQRIVLLRGPLGIDAFDLRAQGVKDALKVASNIEIYEEVITYNINDDREILKEIFINEQFDGIFTAYDLLAMTVNELNSLYGQKRPLKIIGYDGLEMGDYFYPPFSTVTQDVKKLGEKAVELLLKQINEESIDEPMVLLPNVFHHR